MKIKLLFLGMAVLATLIPNPARADGIIIPDPPICEVNPCQPELLPTEQLVIRNHRVSVRIEDQVAVTHVDQIFYNPNDWTVEGTYLFPIPLDATVNGFQLWIADVPVDGEVLEAKEARQVYEEIVRQSLDPALLEYADRGAIRARIFPIPPGGERRIELEYTQILTAENGLVRYVYPLNTEKFSALPLEDVSVSLVVRASLPVRAVYSPTHKVAITRDSEFSIRVGYEDSYVLPDADFALYYSLGENEAFHLLTFRDPGDPVDPDGFFLLLLAPAPEQPVKSIPKDILIVLDRSGSMEGEKFHQAQKAVRYILEHLNPEDRFNVIAFSTGVDSFRGSVRPVSEVREALSWLDRLNAEGSTDINRALLESVSLIENERPVYLIFLTDGLPTEGVVDSQQILDNFLASSPANLRLFAFGVGYDVDTYLLDSLSQNHHGTSTYVLPGERLDESLSAFYAKISTPVLTDLHIDFGDITPYDIFPQPLPDLFLGSQIIVVGRYHHSGIKDLVVSGEVGGERREFHYPKQVFVTDNPIENDTLATLPRLWATRKIGYLLNKIRLGGPEQETIDQIVKLSIRYGIVTAYTSYLVTEPMPLGTIEQERIASEQLSQMQAMATAPSFGREAVEKAADQGSLAAAESVESPPLEAAEVVKIIGSRTFVNHNGVWVDTAFDPDSMETVKVAFLSNDYFSLARSRQILASAFALGQRVIVVSDGIAYEVVDLAVSTQPIDLPPTYTPLPVGQEQDDTPVLDMGSPGTRNLPTQVPVSGSLPCGLGLIPLMSLILGFTVTRFCKGKMW